MTDSTGSTTRDTAAGYRWWTEVRDALVLVWTRVTLCRKHGHHYAIDGPDYCLNCAAPWSGWRITRA